MTAEIGWQARAEAADQRIKELEAQIEALQQSADERIAELETALRAR